MTNQHDDKLDRIIDRLGGIDVTLAERVSAFLKRYANPSTPTSEVK